MRPDDGHVPVHLPQDIGDDDSGICPSCAPLFIAVPSCGGYAAVGAVFRLCIPHILQEFFQEGLIVSEIASCRGEHLCVCHPAVPLIPLRAVCGDAEIIGILSPPCQREQTVDFLIGCREVSRILLH